jgi:hypothetical protein
VELRADQIADRAGRALPALTRRDIAMALLTVPSGDAIESLPGIRRALLAAGNPMSAAFWDSAESVLGMIRDGTATVGDVNGWLSASGTEPYAIIGLHVWDDIRERSPLQEEMHTRLVHHLEEQLAAGAIDPDALLAGESGAVKAFREIQESWMTTALPDGRVPMTVLLDEKDEEFLAEWDAADREALEALEDVMSKAGDRPLPRQELTRACTRIRSAIVEGTSDGQMLAAFGGVTATSLPDNDEELWLTMASGVPVPAGDPGEYSEDAQLDDSDGDDSDGDSEDLDPISHAQASVMSLDHFDWLAVLTALVSGGPGTSATESALAGYVRDYNPDSDDEQDMDYFADEFDDDDFAIEGLFVHVTRLWRALGAIDRADRLTALGWWGLPEAMKRAWTSLRLFVGWRAQLTELLVH